MNWLILLLVLLVLGYLLFIVMIKKWRSKFISKVDRIYFDKHWELLMKEKDLRSKVMYADKLLDEMLKRRGVSGSLGDKLKKSRNKFSDLNGLWSAHKLRNKFAHEVGFHVSVDAVQSSMNSYKKAFRDLDLLK